MTPDQVQQLIDQSIQSKVPSMITSQFDKNYSAGNPRIPPHTHDGVDNLKLNVTSFSSQWQLPIGSLYFSTVSTNPSSLLGYGTWAAYAQGQVPVGFSSGDPNFGTLGGTGGEATHTLTISEMPNHAHAANVGNAPGPGAVTSLNTPTGVQNPAGGLNGPVESNGGGGAHNNIQPYVTVMIWQRTA